MSEIREAVATAPSTCTPVDVDLPRAVEGLLVVLDGPLEPAEVARAWGTTEAAIESAVETVQARCDRERRGYTVRRTGAGWRLFAATDLGEQLRAVVVHEATARLSPAALETLAIVAYRQPVSRSRIAVIRGVAVDGVMRKLTTRGLVADVGIDPTSGATLYATTDLFLELLGLESLAQLPELAPLLPEVSAAADIDA